jgi:anti-sigma factor RsiW
MRDCTNVEMREMLPDLLHGRLDQAARRTVEAHLVSCAECAEEFALLRAVHRAFDEASSVDVPRIVAALPRPQASRHSGGLRAAVRWQVAAALTMLTVGGFSVLVARRGSGPERAATSESTRVPRPAAPVAVPAGPTQGAPAQGVPATPDTRPSVATRPPAAERPALSVAGGVSDLADDELRTLLGALDALDARPATEPDTLSGIVLGAGRGR